MRHDHPIGGVWLDGTAITASVLRYRSSPVPPHEGDMTAHLASLRSGGLSVEVLWMDAEPTMTWDITVGLHTVTQHTVNQWFFSAPHVGGPSGRNTLQAFAVL